MDVPLCAAQLVPRWWECMIIEAVGLDKAINLLVEYLGQISDKMEAAGTRLQEMAAQDPGPMVRDNVDKYLHSVYTIMTGHYEWTSVSPFPFPCRG